MKFWDDELRICPKCNNSVSFGDEPKMECPHCHTSVWFFNYRPISDPPDFPEPVPDDLWKNPTTTLLLISAGLLALVALFAISKEAIVAIIFSMSAIGFAVFAFARHAEAKKIESSLSYLNRMKQYAEIMRNRIAESTERYNSLLQTGDDRVELYYDKIYKEAEKEKNEAASLREATQRDRIAIGKVEQRIYDMAERFIHDHLKWVSKRLRPDPDNYQRNKNELVKAFEFVKSVGYSVPSELEKDSLTKLREDYREKVREQTLKEEQRRIKRQMQEEEKLRKEREKAVREAERQERELQRRLNDALREHKDEHSAEVEQLKKQLEEAQVSSERAKSMAQLTKTGHLYVLSNIGSFGENIFKVGMTRRLEPELRVKELSDASVPFPFDVHAMFSCEDAPTLEKKLHHELTRYRVNRVNFRKEFFNVELQTILDLVRRNHGRIDYVAEPQALEYRESLAVSPEELVALESELLEIGANLEDDED